MVISSVIFFQYLHELRYKLLKENVFLEKKIMGECSNMNY